ncbi:MAG: hypothetical protein R3F60_07395 [bacterium]
MKALHDGDLHALAAELGATPGDGLIRVIVRHAADAWEAEGVVAEPAEVFCAGVLAAEPLATGEEEGLDLDAALRIWRRDFAVRQPGLASQVLPRTGARALRRAAGALAAHPDRYPWVGAPQVDALALIALVGPIAVELHHAAAANRAPDSLLGRNEALLAALEEALPRPAEAALTHLLTSGLRGDRRRGRAAAWEDGAMEAFREALARYQAWYATAEAAWLGGLHARLVEDLHRHLVPRVARSTALRAATLLRQPGPRGRIAAGCRAIVVDAAEGLDPALAEVLALLTRPVAAHGPWTAVPLRPGALHLVVDPLAPPSGAEVERLEALGATVHGRRPAAAEGLAAWLAQAFAPLPGPVGRPASRGLEPVVTLSASSRPADALAVYLRGLEVAPRDVRVLVPTWAEASATRDALLNAGVPATTEEHGSFFGRARVRAALSALRAIDDPSDRAAVVGALRGIFQRSLKELTLLAEAGVDFDYRTADVAPDGGAGPAFVVLRRLHGRRGEPWSTLLHALLAEAGLEPPDAELRRLAGLLDAVEPSALSPGDALDRVEQLAVGPLDDAGDQVRVAALVDGVGPAAPVVALLGLDRAVPPPPFPVVVEADAVAVQLGPLVPPDWKDIQRRARARWLALWRGRVRQAAASATDQLVIVGDGPWRTPELERGLAAGPAPRRARVSRSTLRPWTAPVATRASTPSVPPLAPRARHRLTARGGDALSQVLATVDLSEPAEQVLPEALEALRRFPGGEEHAPALRRLLAHPVMGRARRAVERWVDVPFALPGDDADLEGRLALCFTEDPARRRWVVVDHDPALPPADHALRRRRLAACAQTLLAGVTPCEHVEVVLPG